MLDWMIAPGLLALLLVAQETGFRLGRRRRAARDGAAGAGQVGAVQGAVLGLLGLLLGFSFAGAAGRFIDRQDLITAEANAIGTAYLRADLLESGHAADLKGALKDYTQHRVDVSRDLRRGLKEDASTAIAASHRRMWVAAMAGARASSHAAVVVLPAVNDVIDLHSLRIAAGRKHLPPQIMGLLIGCSVIAMGVMGYGAGLTGPRNAALLASLAVLIGTALWTTIDLDHPRSGLIRLNDGPLAELRFD
jgi:hypothetical protein